MKIPWVEIHITPILIYLPVMVDVDIDVLVVIFEFTLVVVFVKKTRKNMLINI